MLEPTPPRIRIVVDHAPVTMTRYAAPGNDISSVRRVRSIRVRNISSAEALPAVLVDNYQTYQVGCSLDGHRNCNGLLMMTPSLATLIPSSFSLDMGKCTNVFAMLSSKAFNTNSSKARSNYLAGLKDEMLTKHGVIRTTEATLVEGSARLVLSPCPGLATGWVALPESLRSKFRFSALAKDSLGRETSTYEERRLCEGDWVIFCRPPSLWLGNAQPKRVKFWPNASIGVNLHDCAAMSADFDGDEGHIYPVASAAAISECEAWIDIRTPSLTRISRRAIEDLEAESMHRSSMSEDDALKQCMESTTSSISQLLRDRGSRALMAKEAKMKVHLLGSFCDRHTAPSTSASFVDSCISGMDDVMRQQIRQGPIGHITRIARLYCDAFAITDTSYCIDTVDGPVAIYIPPEYRDAMLARGGNPCLRCVESLCSRLQQSALDAHKADSAGRGMRFNAIESFVTDSDPDGTIVISTASSIHLAVWSTPTSIAGEFVGVYRIASLAYIDVEAVVGTYNTTLLGRVSRALGRDAVFNAAFEAVSFITSYSGIEAALDDALAMAAMISYRCETASSHPLTQDGIVERRLHSHTALSATHFRAAPTSMNATRHGIDQQLATTVERNVFFARP